MKKAAGIAGFALMLLLIAGVTSINSTGYHLREFENVKTNFNNYRPTIWDRMRGIHDNQGKWDFHLRRLEELGAVQHKTFVFTEVPYTSQSSRQIWLSAYSNFPKAVMFTAKHYGTNDASYGVNPYVLGVWDFRRDMPHWLLFFQTNNYPH
jgi:hypothetical protein